MRIALFGENQLQFSKVYTPKVLEKLSNFGELSPRINKKNIEEHKDFLKGCEIAFATWGMPKFTKEEIAEAIIFINERIDNFYKENSIDDKTFKKHRNLCGRIQRMLTSSCITIEKKISDK